MTAADIKIYQDIPFDEYLKLPGYSYSGIKHDGKEFAPSRKMIIGTMVHQYLNEPHRFNGDIRIVKPIATAIIKTLGPLYKHLQYETSICCNFCHHGIIMKYRGRIDAGIRNRIVIDFKIGKDVESSKAFFGYDDQLSGYATAYNAPLALIVACNPEAREPVATVIPVTISHKFWEAQVLLKGESWEKSASA